MSTSSRFLMPVFLRLTIILSVSFDQLVLPRNTGLASGDDPFVDFNTYAEAALKDWNTPAMAVSVVKIGRLVFARGYGVRKLGGNDAVDTKTVFPVASITKSFNATALAMLVDDGKLNWTDPVTKYLPDFQLRDPYVARHICITDLLSHRTGLEDPDLLACCGAFTRDELMRRTRFLQQIAPFRIGNRYNNLGPIIAGEILEQVSGQSWADFVRQRILQPLEMNATVPDVLELQGVKNVVTSYIDVRGELRDDKSWNLPLSDGWRRYRETIRPAGSICSTVDDLAKFAMFQLAKGEFQGRRLLKADTILEMQALHSVAPIKELPEPNLTYAKLVYGSGLGWQIRDYRGRKLVMHDGSTGTVIGLMPEENIGVVVLTNLGCGMQFMVMHDILDRVLRIPRSWSNRDFITHTIGEQQKSTEAENARLDRQRRHHVKPQLALRQYAGTYQSDLYGQLVVKETDGILSMQLGPNCRSELVHWSGERFRATFVLRFPEDWFLSFVPQKGQVTQAALVNIFPNREIATFARASDEEQRTSGSASTR
jgi:CubicO group peptidase (beta-lactamase class C family)